MPSGIYERKPGGAGTAGPTVNRLQKLLAFHEDAAKAIRTTLQLLGESQAEDKVARHGGEIEKALQLDAERRGAQAGLGLGIGQPSVHEAAQPAAKPKSHGPGYGTVEGETARRQRSADLLATFDTKMPRPIPDGHKRQVGLLTSGDT